MRIEMCGPPTSGKSTLVRGLRERGIKRGTRMPPEQTPKKWQSFVDFINETYRQTEYKSLPSKTLSSVASAWAADHAKEPKVFDELVMLCGVSMAIRLPKEYADRYFAEAPLPAILVYLTANTNTLIKRNKQRGDRDRSEKTMRAVRACDEYIPMLQKRGCNILTFNTSKVKPAIIINSVLEEINAKKK